MEWVPFLYDVALLFYFASLTFFLSDVLEPNRRTNRVAVVLLFIAFIATTLLLFESLSHFKTYLLYSRTDLVVFMAWLMLLVTLVVDTFLRIGLIVFFANLVGFGMMLVSIGLQGTQPAQRFPLGALLFVHILLAILSEVAFAFAFVFALMFILQEGNLRARRFNQWFLRMPSLALLDRVTFVNVALGFFLLFAAMVTGSVWGELVLGDWTLLTLKSLVTILTWLMYGAYLWRRSRHAASKSWMLYQIVCFTLTLVNLLAIGSTFPVLHPTV